MEMSSYMEQQQLGELDDPVSLTGTLSLALLLS